MSGQAVIEKRAVLAIEAAVQKDKRLRSNIQTDDKIPILDGQIIVYKKEGNWQNSDLHFAVDVQVKGTERKIPRSGGSFSISREWWNTTLTIME